MTPRPRLPLQQPCWLVPSPLPRLRRCARVRTCVCARPRGLGAVTMVAPGQGQVAGAGPGQQKEGDADGAQLRVLSIQLNGRELAARGYSSDGVVARAVAQALSAGGGGAEDHGGAELCRIGVVRLQVCVRVCACVCVCMYVCMCVCVCVCVFKYH